MRLHWWLLLLASQVCLISCRIFDEGIFGYPYCNECEIQMQTCEAQALVALADAYSKAIVTLLSCHQVAARSNDGEVIEAANYESNTEDAICMPESADTSHWQAESCGEYFKVCGPL
jgi:hypothetical protein